jgi:hypothetical protein
VGERVAEEVRAIDAAFDGRGLASWSIIGSTTAKLGFTSKPTGRHSSEAISR